MIIDRTPDHVDISTAANVATIRGATRNTLIAHITCAIQDPVNARKVTVNAGPIDIVAACAVDGTYSETASFSFDAIAGHEYRISMLMPGSDEIELVDDTDRKVIGVHKNL
jgi:hypothetical protein